MNASSGLHVDQYGTVKLRTHILQATLILQLLLEQSADHMPPKTRTLEIGEKVVSKCPLVILAVEGFFARIEHY